jgi:hypothetical protein
MTVKRVLGVMMLVLLACGPGADTPTDRPDPPARPAERDPQAAVELAGTLREHFVWRDASQPAGDWDADAEVCKKRVDEDSSVPEGAHPLVSVAAFIKCMEEMGWASKGQNR